MTNIKHYILEFENDEGFTDEEFEKVKYLVKRSFALGNCKANPCYTHYSDMIEVLIDLSTGDDNIITAILVMYKLIHESRDYEYAFIQQLNYTRNTCEGPYSLL